jgi:8-oxo-dGTP diphosphatase
MSHTYAYPRPSVTVDCAVFGFDPDRNSLDVLLIQRDDEPFAGQWALPGGFVEVADDGDQGEDLEAAALRELSEETGAKVNYLEQLGTFGTPKRDPRGRVISVAYFALVRSKDHVVKGGSDARDAKWFPVGEALKLKLAFDHTKILQAAAQRLQNKIRYAPIGFDLLPERFSIGELQRLYEVLLGRDLDRSNFRKKIFSLGILEEARSKDRDVNMYAFDKEAYESSVKSGFNFEPRFVVKGK